MQVLRRSASILHSFSALAAVRHAPIVHSLVEKANDVRILSSKYCEHHCILWLRLSCKSSVDMPGVRTWLRLSDKLGATLA